MAQKVKNEFNEEELCSLRNSRSYKQYYTMRQSFESGSAKCTFCHLDPKFNSPIYTSKTWSAWINCFAHKHTEVHIVAAPFRHIRFMGEMIKQEWDGFKTIVNFFYCSNYEYAKNKGGGIAIREGSLTHTAGSVPHLHANFIIPDLTGNVKITLAKDLEKINEANLRTARYSKFYEKEVTPEKFDEMCKYELIYTDGRDRRFRKL